MTGCSRTTPESRVVQMMYRLAHASLGAAALLLLGAPASAKDVPPADLGEFRDFLGSSAPSFDSTDELVKRFRSVLAEGDKAKLATLLGLSPNRVEKSDEVAQSLPEIQAEAAKSIGVKQLDPDRVMLLLGDQLWPFPFPAIRKGGKWSFATVLGLEEVINRRIGENELTTIANLRQIVEAQERYRATDWDQDGVDEYAEKLISSPGKYDGLYWQPGDGVPDSPIGPGLSEAELATAAKDGYFGYRYRVLTRQGSHVAGGAYSYMINGNMIAGFGVIATPFIYDRTGVMTFVVNQHGTVYQKDFGPNTAKLAAGIKSFDPDESWDLVEDPGD